MASLTSAERSRRSDILAAAQREFAAAGFSGGRIERIAAAADVNKQLLFHYFDSKQGLFRSALEELLSRSEPPAESPGDQPADEVRRVVGAVQATVQSHPGLLGIIADSTANDGFPPDAAASVRAWRDRLRNRLEAALSEGQRRGYFRDDIDPSAVARAGLAAALGTGALGESDSNVPIGALLLDYCAWR